MKQVGHSDRHVEISGVQETAKLTLHADARMFKNLLDSIYSEKEKTVVRELMANALDAHKMGGCKDREIEVHLPTAFNPTFVVRDFGCGMTHEFMMNLYSALGFSSKTNDNTQTGMFGVGSKSPLSISDSFTVKAFDEDGTVRVYAITVPSDEHPQISYVFRTKQPDEQQERGIEVSVPVDHKRRDAILKGLATQHFCWFDKPVKFLGAIDEIKHQFYTSINSIAKGLYVAVPSKTVLDQTRWQSSDWTVYVRQGAAVYPLNQEQIKTKLKDKINKAIRVLCFGHRHVLIDLPLGTANVTLAREAIQYDTASINNIVKAVEERFEEFTGKLADAIGDAYSFQLAHTMLLSYFFPDEKERSRLVSHKLAAEMLDLVEDKVAESYKAYYAKLPDVAEMEPELDPVTGVRKGLRKTGRMIRPQYLTPRRQVELLLKDFPDGKVLLHAGYLRGGGYNEVHINGAENKLTFKIPSLIFVLPSHLREWKERIRDYVKTTYSADTLSGLSDNSFHIAIVRCAKRSVDDVKKALTKHGIYTPVIVMEELPNVGADAIKTRNFSKTSVYPWKSGTWDESKIEPDYSKPAYYLARVGIAHECHLTHPTKDLSSKHGLTRQRKANNYNVKAIYDDALRLGYLDATIPFYRVTENQAERIANTCPGWIHFSTHLFDKIESKLKGNSEVALGKSTLGSQSGLLHAFGCHARVVQRHKEVSEGCRNRLELFQKIVNNDPLAEIVAAVKWEVHKNPLKYKDDSSQDRLFRALYTFGTSIDRALVDKYDRLFNAYDARYIYVAAFYNDRTDDWVEHCTWYLDKAWTVWEKERLRVNLDDYKELDTIVAAFRADLKDILKIVKDKFNISGDVEDVTNP